MIINKNLELLPYRMSFNESSKILGHTVYIFFNIEANFISRAI